MESVSDDNASKSDSSATSFGTGAMDSSTSGKSGTNSSSEGSDSYKRNLSKEETRHVKQSKLIVMVIMLCAAVGVSIIVYIITKNAEKDQYESQYEATALKVTKSYEGMVKRMGTISNVGMAATIQGIDTNKTWPYVTLTAFQQRSATARSLSAALYVTISPFISDGERQNWEQYVTGPSSKWISEGLAYQEKLGTNIFEHDAPSIEEVANDLDEEKPIFYYNDNGEPTVDEGPGPYLVTWETSPVLRNGKVNENLFRRSDVSRLVKECLDQRAAILGGFQMAPPGHYDSPDPLTSFFATLRSFRERADTMYLGDPMARLYMPIFDTFMEDRAPVGVVVSVIHFTEYFRDLLPHSIKGINVVLENTCDGSFTYQIDGKEAIPLGFGDLHNHEYDSMERYASFANQFKIADGTEFGIDLSQEGCQYSIRVYPTQTFYDLYNTKLPIVITFSVGMVFLFTMFMFWLYDRIVEKRQNHVLEKASQTNKIVSSIFPQQVRDRLMDTEGIESKKALLSGKHQLKSFLTGDGSNAQRAGSQIADLFPACSVLYADIAGFTAWSSAREPEQVFILLQTIYRSFDQLAKRRNVFKVETIGDCYVAVTGLPEAQPKHAVIMARFAYECKHRMNQLVRELESQLGPDTGELCIRMGMSSGPVTAGVLVGSNARFQLFGDTVNLAAKMESTGVKNKIHISKSTADELIASGKEHWIKARQDNTGRGALQLQTFFLSPVNKGGNKHRAGSVSDTASSNGGSVTGSGNDTVSTEDDKSMKRERLVDWMLEIMLGHIKKMVEKRRALGQAESDTVPSNFVGLESGATFLDEVSKNITLSRYDPRAATIALKQPVVDVSEEIIRSLRNYISIIAMAYLDNQFHCFEHACHVTMSVNKLLKRVIAPDLDEAQIKEMEEKGEDIGALIHHYTDGITTDPLSMFAVVFSALIHDVDHRGVSNVQLAKEDKAMADRYRSKSIAEQNSLDVALNLLMSEQFDALRQFVFGSPEELTRFRQIVINAVLATDIFDKQLNELRRKRWEKVFGTKEESSTSGSSEASDEEVKQSGLKATIVIEHMMQASDVSHTMQHWHVYLKWNKRLFKEMYVAYNDGRMGVDPSTFWYKGEMAFFDKYIIPLAEKLKQCNVFGVSSDEYLNYAMSNRLEWEERGEEILQALVAEVNGTEDANNE